MVEVVVVVGRGGEQLESTAVAVGWGMGRGGNRIHESGAGRG